MIIIVVDVTTLKECQQYGYYCWDVNSMIIIVAFDLTTLIECQQYDYHCWNVNGMIIIVGMSTVWLSLLGCQQYDYYCCCWCDCTGRMSTVWLLLLGCQQYDYHCWDVNSMIIIVVDVTALIGCQQYGYYCCWCDCTGRMSTVWLLLLLLMWLHW